MLGTIQLARLLDQRGARWIAIAGTLYIWNTAIIAAPGAYTSAIWGSFISVYFFYVACRAYLRLLATDRSHAYFWAWFVCLLFICGVICILGSYSTGLFYGVIAAFFCDRNTAGLLGNAVHLRGGVVNSASQSAGHYNQARPKIDKGIQFGGAKVPTREATTHFAFCGTVGSGKTVSIRLLMQDVLPGIGQLGSHKRAVIYDPKIEFYSILEGMGFRPQDIVVMNPFDRRCRPWWISKDMVTATDAETLANILVPEKKGGSDGDSFWRSATIISIKAVVRYLNRTAPKTWMLRDLLMALRSQNIIIKMIEDDPRLYHYKQLHGTEKTAANIMATLLSSIERYEPIAALWHKAETVYGNKPYSLTDWTEDSKIILLGKSETADVQMREINRVIITRLGQLLLEKPETLYPESYLIFDELASLDNMTPLINLAEQGRSKGVSLTVGFQSKKHLEENFRENLAIAFLGQFNHIAALRLREEETAKWIAGIVGKMYGLRETTSVSTSWGNPNQYTTQEQYFEESVVDPSELTAIPAFRPDLGYGLKGFYMGHVNWWHTYPPSIIKSLAPQTSHERNFIKMPRSYQELKPWETADYQRLGISHLTQGGMDDFLNRFSQEDDD